MRIVACVSLLIAGLGAVGCTASGKKPASGSGSSTGGGSGAATGARTAGASEAETPATPPPSPPSFLVTRACSRATTLLQQLRRCREILLLIDIN